MYPSLRIMVPSLLLLMTSDPATGSEGGGTTLHGKIEARSGPSIPLQDLDHIDAETIERIRQLRASRPRKEVPDDRLEAPAGATTADPTSPPSPLGSLDKAPDDFVFVKNTSPSSVAPAGMSLTINEPSVVAVGDLVFVTGNTYAALSTDGGDTYSYVNPFTGPFPPTDNGLCCDQVTAYDPASDTMFWVQEYTPDASNGTHRVNVDQGADGTFECFYNVQPSVFGFGAGTWPNLPDLAVSDGFLYHSANVFAVGTFAFEGAFVARYPLAQITQCSGSIPFDVYTDTTGFSAFKLTRGATTTMHFADHISTSSIRIWRWPDASANPTPFDRAVTGWTDNTRVCPGPDGRDWCGRITGNIYAAYVADGTVGFMWVPSQDGTFAFPYTRVARFSELTLSLLGEPLIWSPGFAWVYPSVAVNRDGDLGGTIMAGGGPSLFPSCVAWIADDVNGDAIAPLENQVAFFGTSGPSTNVSGDYSWAQTYYGNDFLWAGACFGLDSTTSARSQYVLFGREKNTLPLFADGFESGNTSAWSSATP